MNRLTQELTRICREHLLAEKWLIAPSLRVGYQWLDAVALGGQPVVNVRVNTLKALVIDLAADVMVEKNLVLASTRCGTVLVDRIIHRLREEAQPFVARLQPSTGLAEAFVATIESIRLAGLGSEDLHARHFDDPEKQQALQAVLDAYLRELVASRLIDFAELLRLAMVRLQDNPAALPKDALLLVPADMSFNRLEELLLAILPAEKVRRLPVDEPAVLEQPGEGSSSPPSLPVLATDTDLLRWLLAPNAAPPPTTQKTVRIVRTVGEVNEVRDVFRRCLAGGIRLDEVELLHTDADTYVPLVYETMLTVVGEGDGDGQPPVTFAEGIPTRYSRPGQALLSWTEWIASAYSQATLWTMIRDRLLEVPGRDAPSPGSLASLFRQVPIRLERARYLEKLDQYRQNLEQQLRSHRAVLDEDGEERSQRAVALERSIEGVKVLHELCSRLLECSPSPGASPHEILKCAKRFLETLARKVNQLDQYAAQRLLAEIEDMQKWLNLDEGRTSLDAWKWLSALPAEARVLGSGPVPGCLHVAHVLSGGHTGRRHTFIVGLDDSRFPGTGFQDPLLLDSERRKLSPALTTAWKQTEEKSRDFARLLARLRGQVTLSYCARGVTDDREMFPSPLVLAAFRLISGQREADHSDLDRWLASEGTTVSFVPAEKLQCLNAAEAWLYRLCGPGKPTDALELVFRQFPHLARGLEAEKRRGSSEFTEHDGSVKQAGLDLDPTGPSGRVLSANQLQKIGTCPLAYFFEYGLGLQLPDDVAVDHTVWLDSLALGSLVHELFERYIRELIAQGRLPEFERDLPRMRELLRERIDAYSRFYPAPGQSVFQKQCDQLEQVALTFLREEEHFCTHQQSRPMFPEASLGMPPGEHGTPLDTTEPIPLRLPGGTIRLRGRIDRIDEIGSGAVRTFGIWDYKSGSTWKYSKADAFRQGRVLQPYLYLTMVAHRLRETIEPASQVKFFGFFFPGTSAGGDRFTWTPEMLTQGNQILDWLCQVVRNGAFLATTDDQRDCTYCDFRGICDDVALVAARSRTKLDNRANQSLGPMRELRSNPLAGK